MYFKCFQIFFCPLYKCTNSYISYTYTIILLSVLGPVCQRNFLGTIFKKNLSYLKLYHKSCKNLLKNEVRFWRFLLDFVVEFKVGYTSKQYYFISSYGCTSLSTPPATPLWPINISPAFLHSSLSKIAASPSLPIRFIT